MAMGHCGTEGPGVNEFYTVPGTQWLSKPAGHHQRALLLGRVHHHLNLHDYFVKGVSALQVCTVGAQCVPHIVIGLCT